MEAQTPMTTENLPDVSPEAIVEFERFERIIGHGIASFLNVAEALIQIRDKQYYKKIAGFETFGEYCETKWGMTRQRAYQLIDAKQVADNLSNNLTKEEIEKIPATQLCTMKSLPEDDQATVYQLAKETAPEGKLTAAHVEKVVREVRGEKKERVYKLTPPKEVKPQQLEDIIITTIAYIDLIKDTDPGSKEALKRIALHVWNRQHRRGDI